MNSIAADANIMQAATAIMGPVQALLQMEAQLKELVAPADK